MDALNIFGLVFAAVIAVLSAGATFFNKKTLEARIKLLQEGNDETRSQNKDLRDERADNLATIAAFKAKDEEKERLIASYKKQPNFAQLTKIISTNHKEVMAALTGILDDKRKP